MQQTPDLLGDGQPGGPLAGRLPLRVRGPGAVRAALAVWRREMAAGRNGWLAWTIPVCLLILTVMWVYPAIEKSAQGVDAYLQALPKQLLAAFNLDRLNFQDPIGFYATEAFALLVLFVGIYGAVMGATILAKEESERTAEFLLSRPVSRLTVVSGKAAAVFTFSLLINAAAALTSIAAFALFAGGRYEPALLWHLAAGSLLVTLCFGALGLAASAALCRVRTAFPLALGGVLGLYFVSMLAGIAESLRWLRYLTPFRYADSAEIILGGGLRWADAAVLLGVTVVATAAACLIYERKDIRA